MPLSLRALPLLSLSLSLSLLPPAPGCSGAQPAGTAEPLLQLPYDRLWAAGLREYVAGRWVEAARLLERSLFGRSALFGLRAACSGQCAREPPDPRDPPGTHSPSRDPPDPAGPPSLSRDPLSQAAFFGRLLRRAACLRRCLSDGLGGGDQEGSRHWVGPEVSAAFRHRSPYHYLQLCYYKTRQLDKAVAAAQTFLAANPEHEEMLENMEMYRRMEGVREEDFRDLEAQEHWVSFENGNRLYEEGQFEASCEQLEAAVGQFLSALEQCRAQCEGPCQFQQYSYLEYQSHLHEAIADHLVQVVGCRQQCVRELGTRRDAPRHLLPSVFNLLQSAYHRVGDYERAVRCSRTFLLFRPQDRAVLQDLDFFRSRLGTERGDEIGAREDVRDYVERSLLEKELLYFAADQLGVDFEDPDPWTPAELIPESIREKQRAEAEKTQTSAPRNVTSRRKVEPKRGLDVLKASSPTFTSLSVAREGAELGTARGVVIDGALSHAECGRLRRLANAVDEMSQRDGDKTLGHQARSVGLTVLQALKLCRDGKVEQEAARLFLQVTERCGSIVDHYFQPRGSLYLSFSHLACSSSSPGNRVDVPSPSRDCREDPESSVCSQETGGARDFSVHLFLNDEFEGGKFQFTDPNTLSVTAEVDAKCGRLVTFRSGDRVSHSVSAVTGGQRCVLSLWFTLDRKNGEKDRAQTQTLRRKLFPKPLPTDPLPGKADRGRLEEWSQRMPAREGGRRRERREGRPSAVGTSVRDEL